MVIDAAAQAAPLAEALMNGGINCVQVTLRTPAALAALEVMAAYDGLVAGAGTLLEPRQAARAADGGARFAVSPGFDPELLNACRAQSLPFLPGVATATEIQRILRSRADLQVLSLRRPARPGGLGRPVPRDALRCYGRHQPIECRWLPPLSAGARRRRHMAGSA